MGLKTTVDVNGGLRKLTDSRSDVRQWKYGHLYWGSDPHFTRWYNYTETTNEKTYKWWGLTKSAADGEVSVPDQSECGTGEVASYECSIDNRVIGSYTLTKTITSITVDLVIEDIEEEE